MPPPTPTGRLRLARCVVEDGWPLWRAAERFQVSHSTAARWAGRYRAHGLVGMEDRSSRPHHQPLRTPVAVEEQAIRLRREHRIGPLRLGGPCRRRRLHRTPDPATSRPACSRRTGPGHRRAHPPLRTRPARRTGPHQRQEARPHPRRRRSLSPGPGGRSANKDRRNGVGYAYLHTALDDHTRLAYTEDLPDGTAPTCAGFLTRATAWFTARGITISGSRHLGYPGHRHTPLRHRHRPPLGPPDVGSTSWAYGAIDTDRHRVRYWA